MGGVCATGVGFTGSREPKPSEAAEGVAEDEPQMPESIFDPLEMGVMIEV